MPGAWTTKSSSTRPTSAGRSCIGFWTAPGMIRPFPGCAWSCARAATGSLADAPRSGQHTPVGPFPSLVELRALYWPAVAASSTVLDTSHLTDGGTRCHG